MAEAEADHLNVARRLILGSDKKQYPPFDRVNYQSQLNPDRWQFPEHLLSLYHHPIYTELSAEQKWRLSLLEAANFFSINIHGEQSLVAGMEPRLYRNRRVGEDPVSSTYMQRFIHEENSHTYMLAGYCIRYAGEVFPDRSFAVASPSLSPAGEDLLYWGRTLVLEIFLGYVNESAFACDSIDRTAGDIHKFHFTDEVRHKAWDKAMIAENARQLSEEGRQAEKKLVRTLLDSYIAYVAAAMCNPAVYKQVGIAYPLLLRKQCLGLPEYTQGTKTWSEKATSFFDSVGVA